MKQVRFYEKLAKQAFFHVLSNLFRLKTKSIKVRCEEFFEEAKDTTHAISNFPLNAPAVEKLRKTVKSSHPKLCVANPRAEKEYVSIEEDQK